MGGRDSKPAKAGAKSKSGGGLLDFIGRALSNASIELNVGGGVAPPRAPKGGAADPAARMEPVEADRKETYDEMVYRKTDGSQGQAPAVRVDRDRQSIARSLGERADATRAAPAIPDASSPLPGDLRKRMEPRLGADLSNVRVSTTSESAGS